MSRERLLDKPEASISEEIDQLQTGQAPEMALFFEKEAVSTFGFKAAVYALADIPLQAPGVSARQCVDEEPARPNELFNRVEGSW